MMVGPKQRPRLDAGMLFTSLLEAICNRLEPMKENQDKPWPSAGTVFAIRDDADLVASRSTLSIRQPFLCQVVLNHIQRFREYI